MNSVCRDLPLTAPLYSPQGTYTIWLMNILRLQTDPAEMHVRAPETNFHPGIAINLTKQRPQHRKRATIFSTIYLMKQRLDRCKRRIFMSRIVYVP